MLRNAVFALAMISVAGCASQLEQQQLQAVANFVGPRDDILGANALPPVETSKPITIGDEQFVKFPPRAARECNATRDVCRVGVVETELRYTVEKIRGDTIEISGRLVSKVGRSGSVESTTISASDDAHQLPMDTKVYPLPQTMTRGQRVEVTGLEGTQVSLELR